jgi:hypothetical protein
MARAPKNEQGSPTEEPRGPPRDLHPIADIRFVITELATLGQKIENLAEKISEMKSEQKDGRDRLHSIEKGVAFVKGALWVFGGIFAIMLVILGVLLRKLI